MPITVTTSYERQSSTGTAISTITDGPAAGVFAPIQGTSSKAEFTPNEAPEKSARPRNSFSIAYLAALALTHIDIYLTQVLCTVGVAVVLAGYFLFDAAML
jgi:hypothetical protein